MIKKVLGSIICLLIICNCICFAADSGEIVYDAETLKYLQYYVKWDSSREPEDVSITEEEYLASLEKDKNNNGILDELEEEEDDVFAAAIPTGILGDLNGDEKVDNRDVVLLYRHIAGWDQDINKEFLDLNGDGYVNNSDAGHLLKYVSGWPDITLYKGKKYDIIYHLYNESMYHEAEITNVNQNYYYSSEGLTLKNIQADGYTFEGWYDGEGQSATRIRKIEAGETGEIELYARWTPRTFTISFDSAYVPVETKYYTIETGATLTNPSLTNYMFVGWTEKETGRLVKAVPKGTFGNLTLVANWASRRNIARPVRQLGDPIIAEDDENGRIVFIYRLGDIENVPLFTQATFATAEGVMTSLTFTKQTSISVSDARTLSSTVAKATTDSATWTLSEGWNDSTTVSNETCEEQGLTREEAETIAKTDSNTYRMDTTQSYSDVIVDSSDYAFKATSGTGASTGQTHTTESNFKLSVDSEISSETTVGAEVKVPKVATVKAEEKVTAKIGASAEAGGSISNSGTSTKSWNETLEEAGQRSSARTTSKNWNNTSSYGTSSSLSTTALTSKQVSELIANKYSYGTSYSTNGEHSEGREFATQSSQENQYSNTVAYDKSELHEVVTKIEFDGKTDGYYRQVLASTAHVFGVVGYDVATASYFTYTFTVMDDNTFTFLDYSKFSSNFNDNEISVIPFEIPSFVNDYVNSRIAKTDGLEISMDGRVTGYSGDDPIVIIPSFRNVYNNDGTYTSVKVTSIAPGVFKNNKNIVGVMLSDYITAIPDSAFEGCTALRDINAPALTHIGNRAFYGCTSLGTLTIPEDVVSIGSNAFYNVNEVIVRASSKDVALAAVNSGAKSVVLNISAINSQMNNAVLSVPSGMNTFEVQGGRKDYSNLRIKSQANKTVINGINFVGCTQVPMELHSSAIELNQTSASASGYCMIVAADHCNLSLFGTNQLTSSSGNAVVWPSTTLLNSDSSVTALLKVTGNVRVYGTITNQDKYLSLINDSYIINLTQEQYNNYISGVFTLLFDVNGDGASVQETERTAFSGTALGELPTPTRTGYIFNGWYTAASGGDQVTASTSFTTSGSVTIYAHWTPRTYTVTYNANGGSVSTSSKTVTYDSTYGTLATPTRTGYTFDGWYTAASGGSKVTSSTKVTITANQTLYAHWTAVPYTLTFNANGGTLTGESTRTVLANQQIGTLPTDPTRSGCNFKGWYTAANGGTRITATTTYDWTSNITAYAHWESSSSGWVLRSAVPSGATIIETSWSYRESTESTSSSLSGWTSNGSEWRKTGSGSRDYATFPSTYKTSTTCYTTMRDGAYTASNNGSTKREVSNVHGGWVYWHWMYNVTYASGTGRTISDRYGNWNADGSSGGPLYQYFYEIKSTVDCPYLDKYYCCSRNQSSYNCHSIIPSNADKSNTSGLGTDRFFRIEYFTSTYTDYQMIYYYYRNVNYASTKPNPNNVTNLTEYVRWCNGCETHPVN